MNRTTLYSASLASALISGFSTAATASTYEIAVTNLTHGMHFTPLLLATHSPEAMMFSAGIPASAQLQAIAEGGDTAGMNTLLSSIGATVANGDGLVAPGGTATFMIEDGSGSVLSLAGMLLPTNDGFVGLNSVSLPSGAAGSSVVHYAVGYDAGTEANDEVVGSGAPGESGFPAPPPIVATGTGTGASGVDTQAEGFVHVHRNVLGDLEDNGGVSDINSAVHRWLNPVARVTITKMAGEGGVTSVADLRAAVYSATAIEIFWQAATSTESYVTAYEIRRNGTIVETRDGTSFFEDNLNPGTEYTYEVTAIDAAGNASGSSSVVVRTNTQ